MTVAAAASFLTPVATPANLMVMGPAATASATTGSSACRCWSLFGVVAVLLVPVIWPF